MKKILVLSGGGSLGTFEAAILSQLILQGKGSWDLITGVSAGSINASYLSTIDRNKEIDNITIFKNLWCSIKNKDVFNPELFLNGLSIYNTNKYKIKLETIFKDKKILRPLMINATSLNTSTSKIFTEEDIEKYGFIDVIMSSSSIPILFPPYRFMNDFFIDGGFSSNIVLDQAIKYSLNHFPDEEVEIDVIICGHFIDKEVISEKELNFKKLIEKIIGIIEQQMEYFEVLDKMDIPSNIKINIYQPKNKLPISFLNFDKGEELWELGSDFKNISIKKY
jgi:predicted patatin/cPLA2 family phospholipase